MSRKNNLPNREYGIVLSRSAERDLNKLEKSDKKALAKIDEKISGLAIDPRPRGMDKIEGIDGLFRIRSGDYRILYSIDDAENAVTIEAIGNRRDVYRQY